MRLNTDAIEQDYQRWIDSPGAPEQESFDAMSFAKAGLTSPIRGSFDYAGVMSDVLSGYGTAMASTMPGGDEASKALREGRMFDATAGNVLRKKADEFTPNPETAHAADQVISGLGSGIFKAVAAIATTGPVAGSAIFGLEEGGNTYQRLVTSGVDPATAAKVAGVTGVAAGLTAGLPAGGSTWMQTAGIAIGGGPVAYAAQEKLARDILSQAGYQHEADKHDPTDSLGLLLSIGIPGAVGAIHMRGVGKQGAAYDATSKKLDEIVKHIESGGNRYAKDGSILTSPKGAQGEMQVMPGTAKDPGFGVAPAKDDSPEELARVGRDYRRAMLERYRGDTDKMFAAYNAGPGAVDAAVKAHGDGWLAHTPNETQAYVGKAQRMLRDAAVSRGASDPAVVDAARVHVLESTVARSLPDRPGAYGEVMQAADDLAAGDFPVMRTFDDPERLPATEHWSTPRAPTPAEMAEFGRVESVPIESAYSTQAARQWRKFNDGEHPPALVDGYSDRPVAARMADGSFVILDGHHRTELAKQGGASTLEMNVIDAKAYDPQNAGKPIPAKQPRSEGDDALLAELESALTPARQSPPPRTPSNAPPEVQRPASRSDPSMLPDARSTTVEPEATVASKTEAPVDRAAVERIAVEQPKMPVKLPGSDETITVETALARIKAEQADEAQEAEWVKVALECALSGGRAPAAPEVT